MNMDVLRKQLVTQLTGGQAYTAVERIVRGFPAELASATSGKMRHTGWELLEHLRIAQQDILRFTIDATYESPAWPDGYWPLTSKPPSGEAWQASVDRFLADLESVKALARDSGIDLFETIVHGSGQTVLREILLVADHNAYHLGQLLQLQRTLEAPHG